MIRIRNIGIILRIFNMIRKLASYGKTLKFVKRLFFNGKK